MTANTMQGDHERCLAAGMDDHVSKPVELDKLVKVITLWAPVKKTDSLWLKRLSHD